MNKENNNLNNVLPSFSFSKKEYLQIFNINSLLTLNNFINTINKISPKTVYRIFIYGMAEFQKNLINSPEITINISTKVVKFINKNTTNKEVVDKIYKIILSAKDLDDFEKIKNIIK
jgi:Glu-tRNA(Gln) amidotransferase subunit E-like FAD-binding protein